MAKKQLKKCYAIHFINEKRDEIVFSWRECQEKMKGHNNMFKGFMTEEEAKKWLTGITKEKEEHHNKQVELHKQQKRAKNIKISTPKTYTFMLDEKYSKVLDEWLSARKMKLSDYMKEIIELDMCED